MVLAVAETLKDVDKSSKDTLHSHSHHGISQSRGTLREQIRQNSAQFLYRQHSTAAVLNNSIIF